MYMYVHMHEYVCTYACMYTCRYVCVRTRACSVEEHGGVVWVKTRLHKPKQTSIFIVNMPLIKRFQVCQKDIGRAEPLPLRPPALVLLGAKSPARLDSLLPRDAPAPTYTKPSDTYSHPRIVRTFINHSLNPPIRHDSPRYCEYAHRRAPLEKWGRRQRR